MNKKAQFMVGLVTLAAAIASAAEISQTNATAPAGDGPRAGFDAHRSPSVTPSSPPALSAKTNLIRAKLGDVEVSDGVRSVHDIGQWRTCTVDPTILKDGRVGLKISVSERTKMDMMLVSSIYLEAQSDQTVSTSNGVIAVSLTPHIKK